MLEILNQLDHWHWFVLAALLAIFEIVLGASFFLLWLALAAGIIAVLLIFFPAISWKYQLTLYAIEAIASVLFWHFHLKHNPATSDKPYLNRRSAQYIGRVFTLEQPIENGRGKICVDDSHWRIEGTDLAVGTKVKVVSVNGVILQVKELK